MQHRVSNLMSWTSYEPQHKPTYIISQTVPYTQLSRGKSTPTTKNSHIHDVRYVVLCRLSSGTAALNVHQPYPRNLHYHADGDLLKWLIQALIYGSNYFTRSGGHFISRLSFTNMLLTSTGRKCSFAPPTLQQ